MYKRNPTPAFLCLIILFLLSDVFAVVEYIQGEITIKYLVYIFLLPVWVAILWLGRALIAVVVYAVAFLFYSPLFLIAYISDWIHRLRKKDP